MKSSTSRLAGIVTVAIFCSTLGGCAATMSAATQGQTSRASESSDLERMLSLQSATQGQELEKIRERASSHPLGSVENPVRAVGPSGQRAYLSRLRCADTSRPKFYRIGNVGVGIYGNIVDLYSVECEDSQPAKSEIYMDMYHAGYSENEPVPGFGITGGRTTEE